MNASLFPRTRFVCCAALTMLFLQSIPLSLSNCFGDPVQGDLIGVFPGTDSESSVSANVDPTVFLLAKVEVPATMNDGLSFVGLTFNDDGDPTSGTWSYSGPELVDYLIIKTTNHYAVYHYTDANTNNMRNMGIWDTFDIPNQGNNPAALSHMSAYTIPEPGSGFVLGLLLIPFAMRHRSR